MIATGSISTVIEKTVATITFSHPASNSLPSALLQQLTDELYALNKNTSLSIIVIKSEGTNTFCSGASFDELLALDTEAEGTEFFSGFANVLNAMRTCHKLIIGRIHGKAVGGGVGLAAACDYCFATDSSLIRLSELAVGIGPFVIEPALSRKLSKMAFTELALNPTVWKSAQWALENKLYSEVLPTADALDERLHSFVSELSSYNPLALSSIKKVLWEGTENWEELLYERAAISGKLVLSEATKIALQKFKK
jgi:methylglutaconyl-CoA hydratase